MKPTLKGEGNTSPLPADTAPATPITAVERGGATDRDAAACPSTWVAAADPSADPLAVEVGLSVLQLVI